MSLLKYDNFRAPTSFKTSADQTTLSNPFTPPCKWLGPSLACKVYSLPSIEKLPFAILLPYLPINAPK